METFLNHQIEATGLRLLNAIFGDCAPDIAQMYGSKNLTLDQRILARGVKEQMYGYKGAAKRKTKSNRTFWKLAQLGFIGK